MKPDQSNTYFILGFLLICGRLNYSVFATPAFENKMDTDTAAATADNMQTTDYESLYNDDEEDTPAEQIKPNAPKNESKLMPYFEETTKTTYSMSGKKLVLDCPVKNYDASKHNIVWWKETNTITNGQETLSDAYQVDSSYSLIIEKLDNATAGNYYCDVMPTKLRRRTIVVIGETPHAVPTELPELANKCEKSLQTYLPSIIAVMAGIFVVHQMVLV